MMLRFILISLGFISLNACIEAQQLRSLGLKTGISISNQHVLFTLPDRDYRMETQILAGPSASFFVEFAKGERWSLETDLSYSSKGSSTTTESITVYHLENNRITENEGELTSTRMHYLSLAPQLRYRFPGNKLRPYLLLGPRIDLLMGYSNDSGYPLDEQNKIIPGISTGAGLELQAGRLGLFLEGLYLLDALPLTQDDPVHIRNRGGQVNLGIRLYRPNL